LACSVAVKSNSIFVLKVKNKNNKNQKIKMNYLSRDISKTGRTGIVLFIIIFQK
jgi:hypothetical protein